MMYVRYPLSLRNVDDLPAERGTGAMERAGAGNLVGLKPAGLDTILRRKWGGVDLSGGQWQRLSLSRSVFRDQPLLVVFEEPAAALDPIVEHEMFERFAAEARSERAAGSVTVLVSHRFLTVRMADLTWCSSMAASSPEATTHAWQPGTPMRSCSNCRRKHTDDRPAENRRNLPVRCRPGHLHSWAY